MSRAKAESREKAAVETAVRPTAPFGSSAWYRNRWQTEWDDLKDNILFAEQQMGAQIEAVDAGHVVQNSHYHMSRVLKNLAAFGDYLFDFILTEYYGSDDNPVQFLNLLHQVRRDLYLTSKKHSPNHVLNMFFYHASVDLGLIQQAYLQRHVANPLHHDEMCFFNVVDKITEASLAPAVAAKLLSKETAVITYLSSKVEVRLLPYDQTMLIGLPRAGKTRTKQMDDDKTVFLPSLSLLAIPHEIGHSIYLYSQISVNNTDIYIRKFLRSRLAQHGIGDMDWPYYWLAEIFSDVYSCLISGPATVLSFQLLMGDNVPLDEDALHHPITALRPLIQSQVLRSIADPYGNHPFKAAADKLDERWLGWVRDNWLQWVSEKWPLGYEDNANIILDASYLIKDQVLTGTAVLAQLQVVIDAILQVLEHLEPLDMAATWTPDWEPAQGWEALVHGYEMQFCFDGTHNNIATQAKTRTAKATSADDSQNWPISGHLRQLKHEPHSKPGLDSLIGLIFFQGWANEGPDDDYTD